MEDIEIIKRTLESLESALKISTHIYADVIETQKNLQDDIKSLAERIERLEDNESRN